MNTSIPNVPSPAGHSAMGILGRIAIAALEGTVRGIQAQDRRETFDQTPSTAAARDHFAQDSHKRVDATAQSKADQNRHPQTTDRRTLMSAQLQYYGLRNIRMAHDIDVAKKSDPHKPQILQTQARNAKVVLAQNAESLGLTKIVSGLQTYSEANELGLAKKLGRGQIVPVANPDGSVDVYELPADAAYTPTTQPLAIRKPIGLQADGTVKWDTVGTVPQRSMTEMEVLTQIVLPEQKAAAHLIRSAMTARGDQ